MYSSRIVLGAVSRFLCDLLNQVPSGSPTVVLLPGTRREVAEQLVEFIYTGYMQVYQDSQTNRKPV